MVRHNSVRFRCDCELHSVVLEHYALLCGVFKQPLSLQLSEFVGSTKRLVYGKLRAVTEPFPHVNEIELHVFDYRAALTTLAAPKREIIGLLRLHLLIAEEHFQVAFIRAGRAERYKSVVRVRFKREITKFLLVEFPRNCVIVEA